jgi:RsmE family RNA methyltransferase
MRVSDYLNTVLPPKGPANSNVDANTPEKACIPPQSTISDNNGDAGVMIAIGPEGGWLDEEVLLFQQRGFQLVNLGPRVLRTDIAVSTIVYHLYTQRTNFLLSFYKITAG